MTRMEVWGIILLNASLRLKEVFYLLLVLWEVASINDLGVELTGKLGLASWPPEMQMQRLNAYVNLTSSPLCIPFLGMRPTLAWVRLQIGAYSLAIALGILKSVFLDHATYD